MKKYYFGSGTSRDRHATHGIWECEAKSLDAAVKRFKLEVLFPERYVDHKYVEKVENSYDNEEAKKTQRSVYTFKDNPKITVTTKSPWYMHEWKKNKEYGKHHKDTPWPYIECELTLMECINVNYNDILPQQKLIPGVAEAPEKQVNLPVVGTPKELRGSNKMRLREMTDEINRKRYDLECQKDELESALKLMQLELKQKMRGLYILETFLGVKEEILQIAEGLNAPDELHLSIHQQLLYMDEEYGVWENQGLDFKNIQEFDKWVVPNIDKFIHSKKGVVAFRVRRNDKKYAFGGGLEAAFFNNAMNERNRMTYFLIRNGENIYRIWSNISVYERLFPTLTEYQKLIENESGTIISSGDPTHIGRSMGEVKVEEHHRRYMYGFTAIQGLIERTPIFPGMQGKTNLLRGNTTNIDLIRDDEKEFWLHDGRPTWREYLKKNRETICQGTRILIWIQEDQKWHWFGNYEDEKLRFTGGNPGISSLPFSVPLVVEEEWPKDRKWYYNYDFKIMYNPGDTVYNWWDPYDEPHERKRRVGCWLNKNEVVNFDAITLEEIDYYMKNRNYRGAYLEVLGLMAKVKEMKEKEHKLETPLVDLIMARLELSDPVYELDIRDAIHWWKVKNKWKRNVMDNDNVVRMVTKRLRRSLCQSN